MNAAHLSVLKRVGSPLRALLEVVYPKPAVPGEGQAEGLALVPAMSAIEDAAPGVYNGVVVEMRTE